MGTFKTIPKEIKEQVLRRIKEEGITVASAAADAGISRSTLYYKTKRDDFDQEMKKQIHIVLGIHPAYGHKRIALEFPLNKKRILRVMKKFNIKPYRQHPKSPKKTEDYGKPKTK